MLLIDTHSHVYSTEFENDRPEMIRRALDAGVGTILMPAIDRSTHGLMLDTEKDNAGHCLSMMGLHPCSVKADFEDELQAIERFLQDREFHGIGETGLDFYWDLTFTD